METQIEKEVAAENKVAAKSVFLDAPATQPMTPAVVHTGGFMSIIERASELDNVDVDKLERMMQMQLQWEDRQAEKQYNEAMTQVSEKISHIKIVRDSEVQYENEKGKPEKGKYTAFTYIKLEKVDPIVRPILIQHGFHVAYDTEPCTIPGWHTIVVWFSHTGGHRKSFRIPMPLETSGGKNNAQAMGSTQMYGMRRAFCAALNILPIGEDNDGAGVLISDDQKQELVQLIEKTEADTVKFLKYMKVDSVDQIAMRDFGKAQNLLKTKAKKNQKAKETTDADNS